MTLLRTQLGNTLRGHRLRQRRTLRDVSGAARVSLGYLSEVERGQKEASSELLASICDALDVELADLLAEVSLELRGVARRRGPPAGALRPTPPRPPSRPPSSPLPRSRSPSPRWPSSGPASPRCAAVRPSPWRPEPRHTAGSLTRGASRCKTGPCPVRRGTRSAARARRCAHRRQRHEPHPCRAAGRRRPGLRRARRARSTMQSVAAAAGVAKATLYNYFRTKDERRPRPAGRRARPADDAGRRAPAGAGAGGAVRRARRPSRCCVGSRRSSRRRSPRCSSWTPRAWPS